MAKKSRLSTLTKAGHLFWLITLFPVILASQSVLATPVLIDSIVTTFHSGTEADLHEAIDGVDVGHQGWHVAPNTQQVQSAIFRPAQPVDTSTMEITLCFLSGFPDSFFCDFTISATTDPDPTFEGNWQNFPIERISTTGPELSQGIDGHLHVKGWSRDAVFQVTVRPIERPVTGFRLNVFPSYLPPDRARLQISPTKDGDFMLTEFRVDATAPRTTNLALHCPVRASEPVRFLPEYLTDGLPGTFSHPTSPGWGSAFYFEIDLGAVHKIDHISLRNRGDGNSSERLSQLILDLYLDTSDPKATPSWIGHDRADGSHPGVGEVDVVRAGDGVGSFIGRWLRISSNSPIAFCPQLAEVEVYPQLDLQLKSLAVDGIVWPSTTPLSLPPGAKWLTLAMTLIPLNSPEDLPCRWRFRGYQTDWQPAKGLVAQGACPPPGTYLFEAQVRHTDGEWNATSFTIPIEFRGYFWQARGFRETMGLLAILGLAWFAQHLTRLRVARRLAKLEAEAALDEQRARIARDMHDEVGARLLQVAILQDIFARDHELSAAAQQDMEQLAQTTRKVVDSLDEVVWAINPKNDTLASLAEYLGQCATDYLSPVEVSCHLDAPFEWAPIEVRATVRHHLVLAFREALQNILKHSGATEVLVKLRHEGSRFVITVQDNGRGLPQNTDGLGKDGLTNMSTRLAAIGGTFTATSPASGGTQIQMSILL